jgi:energy-coupling factor transporter ATP-binding protein EcfA2
VARERAHLLAAAFGQFSGFNGFSFSHVRTVTSTDRESILQRRWPHRIIPPEAPATAAQVACLYHPPVRADLFERLHSIGYQRTPAHVTGGAILLGDGTDGRGRRIEVRVSARDLLRHSLLLGPSGSGKSTLLAHMALELAHEGHGLTVIDPHGSLVRDIARSLPRERASDAYLLRFSDSEHPISLNPLRARHGQEAIAADELVEIVQRVYGREYWGPLLDLTLRHVAIAAMQLRGSLIEAARLLDDPWFREKALSRLENVETARFLAQLSETAAYDRRSLPAVHRLQRLLATPWLRNIVGQGGPGLDFGEAFDSRQTLLLDLSGLGATNAKLLGSLILLMIRQTTLGRSAGDSEIKPRHFVIVDEASWFVSRTVAELFDQARKFGVGLVLAIQRLGQLTPQDAREAVIANSGTLVVFRVSDREEATFFGRHFASQLIGAADLQRLPRYEAYVQLTRDGDREEPCWLRTAAPAAETGGKVVESRLVAAGRQRYARPRGVVERELLLREQSLAEDEEPEVRRLAVPAAAVPAYTT